MLVRKPKAKHSTFSKPTFPNAIIIFSPLIQQAEMGKLQIFNDATIPKTAL